MAGGMGGMGGGGGGGGGKPGQVCGTSTGGEVGKWVGLVAGTAAGAYFGVPMLGAAGGAVGKQLGSSIDPPGCITPLDPKQVAGNSRPPGGGGNGTTSASATESAKQSQPGMGDDPTKTPQPGDQQDEYIRKILELQQQQGIS